MDKEPILQWRANMAERMVKCCRAAWHYTTTWDRVINNALRTGGKMPSVGVQLFTVLLRAQEEAQKHPLPSGTLLYRGVFPRKGQFVDDIKVGDLITDPGFSSFSFSFDVARFFSGNTSVSCIFKIETEPGLSGIHFGRYGVHVGEEEILLGPGLQLRVQDIKETPPDSTDPTKAKIITVRVEGFIETPNPQLFHDPSLDSEYNKIISLLRGNYFIFGEKLFGPVSADDLTIRNIDTRSYESILGVEDNDEAKYSAEIDVLAAVYERFTNNTLGLHIIDGNIGRLLQLIEECFARSNQSEALRKCGDLAQMQIIGDVTLDVKLPIITSSRFLRHGALVSLVVDGTNETLEFNYYKLNPGILTTINENRVGLHTYGKTYLIRDKDNLTRVFKNRPKPFIHRSKVKFYAENVGFAPQPSGYNFFDFGMFANPTNIINIHPSFVTMDNMVEFLDEVIIHSERLFIDFNNSDERRYGSTFIQLFRVLNQIFDHNIGKSTQTYRIKTKFPAATFSADAVVDLDGFYASTSDNEVDVKLGYLEFTSTEVRSYKSAKHGRFLIESGVSLKVDSVEGNVVKCHYEGKKETTDISQAPFFDPDMESKLNAIAGEHQMFIDDDRNIYSSKSGIRTYTFTIHKLKFPSAKKLMQIPFIFPTFALLMELFWNRRKLFRVDGEGKLFMRFFYEGATYTEAFMSKEEIQTIYEYQKGLYAKDPNLYFAATKKVNDLREDRDKNGIPAIIRMQDDLDNEKQISFDEGLAALRSMKLLQFYYDFGDDDNPRWVKVEYTKIPF